MGTIVLVGREKTLLHEIIWSFHGENHGRDESVSTLSLVAVCSVKVSKTFRISRRGSWSKASRPRREGRKEDRSATSVLHKIRPGTNFSDPPLCRDRLSLESSSRFVRIILPLDLLYLSWILSCLLTFADSCIRRRREEEEKKKKKIMDVCDDFVRESWIELERVRGSWCFIKLGTKWS